MKVPGFLERGLPDSVVRLLPLLAALFSMAFLGCCFWGFAERVYWLPLLPVGVAVALLFLVRFEYMLLATAFFTPFALNVEILNGMELSLPVEPLMIAFTGVFLIHALLSGSYNLRLLRHPVSILLLLSLVWMFVTACCSELPLVSFKALAARLWFVIPFFFAAAQLFQNKRRIRQFFWCYALGLAGVVLYATFRTVGHLHDLQLLHRAMCPFYNDHTSYGCVLSLMLPAGIYLVFAGEGSRRSRMAGFVVLGLMALGLYLSFSRAAWLGFFAAVLMFFAIRLGVKLKWMALLAVLAVGFFFAYQSDILYQMGKNHQDSSQDASEQIRSMTNIATDDSNLERLNRWASAFRLWQESPVLGCGPGTYQFLYASYQRSYQKSLISTNSGDLGNAHSEYIGPLAEQGIVGVLLVLVLFGTTFSTGVKVYRTAKDRRVGQMALFFALSLLTYYVHGFFNNFLDTDKLSVPFWAFTAVIVSLDVYAEKKLPGKSSPTEGK